MAMFCSVFGCNTKREPAAAERKDRKDTAYVWLFPKEREKDRRHAWTVFCGREKFTPGPKTGICHRHFSEDDLENAMLYDFKRATDPSSRALLLLKSSAVPTLNPPVPKEMSKSAIERQQRASDKHHDETILNLLNDQDHDILLDDEPNDSLVVSDMEEMTVDDLVNDPTWDPNTHSDEPETSNRLTRESLEDKWQCRGRLADQDKFIVSGKNLLDLLFGLPCETCGAARVDADISQYGAVLSVTMYCDSNHKSVWHTAGDARSDTKVMNALLTGSILYTGSQPAKVSEYMSANKVKFPSESLFFKYQLEMFCAVVLYCWLEEQKRSIALSKEKEQVIVGGDARCDCMGYCAQFGSYGVMDLRTNRLLDIQAVSRVETDMNSYAMEMEGLLRSLSYLSSQGLHVTDLVTDQHPSITKMMPKDLPNIRHWFDSWHVIKGIRKKLVAVTKEKPPRGEEDTHVPLTLEMVDSISNRLYFMSGHTTPDRSYPVIMEEKRKGILSHLVGVHRFPFNTHYKRCNHKKKTDALDAESPVYKKVKAILSTPQRIKAIAKLSPYGQTSRLESYHRVVLSFAPKHLSFGFQGMYSRLLLAGLRYNENCNREVLEDEDGQAKLSVSYLKYKGGKGKATKVRSPLTKDYLHNLMRVTECVARGDDSIILPSLPVTPATMTSQMDTELKADVKSRYASRFRMAEAVQSPEPLHRRPDSSMSAASTSVLAGAAVSPQPSVSGLQSPNLSVRSRRPKASSTPTTSRVVATPLPKRARKEKATTKKK